MGKFDTVDRMAALVLEVERRKKLPGLADYSYGRLIADTTEDERTEIECRYRRSKRKKTVRSGVYREAGEEYQDDLKRAVQRATQAKDA